MISGVSFCLKADGRLGTTTDDYSRFDANIADVIVNNITNHSMYAFEYQLGGGYVTLPGGHRAGICGRVRTSGGKICGFSKVCSVNIRLCKNIKLYDEKHFAKLHTASEIYTACIVSPPKCGKTTFLKNYIMYLAQKMPSLHICVADERNELCGGEYFYHNNIMGGNTSVISDCSKDKAAEMFVRCMSPGVVIFDEVWTTQDIQAVYNVVSSGVSAVFSVHGTSFEKLCKKESFASIMPYLQCYADISSSCGTGTVERIGRLHM